MTTQPSSAVRDYLARMRTALADLPAAEVDEILEDVRPHLVQIGTELGPDATVAAVTERLGSPESYAAELRSAGDYPPPDAPTEVVVAKTPSRFPARLALYGLVAAVLGAGLTGFAAGLELTQEVFVVFLLIVPVLVASAWYVSRRGIATLAELPELRWLARFSQHRAGPDSATGKYLRSIQAAWWLLSALSLVVLGALLVSRRGEALLALFALAALAGVTVWAAPKLKGDRRWLWLGLPVAALSVGGVLGVIGYVSDMADNPYAYGSVYQENTNRTSGGQPALYYGDNSLDNLYVFDAKGKPLSDVYIYDEKGNPLNVPRYACDPDSSRRATQGSDNRFPRPRLEDSTVTSTGVPADTTRIPRSGCKEVSGVPFAAAIPTPSSVPNSSAPNSSAPNSAAPSSGAPSTTSPAPGTATGSQTSSVKPTG